VSLIKTEQFRNLTANGLGGRDLEFLPAKSRNVRKSTKNDWMGRCVTVG